ncbi:uncharacterized protein LOC130663906 [Microplitis mediator]|uniref:uncharacterized protein LOC130663906 n=1 Tax=Microplitis mediator TaxID=375433 RepID=UPI002557C504|nr:uncharacterized protein LOC130663906 [Microplitis mediator]
MLLNRLGSLTCQLARRNLLQRVIARSNTQNTQASKNKNKKDDDDDDEIDQPIQYSTSPAAEWQARYSQQGANRDNWPWYQPHIIAASTFTFLIYFVYLREANDIDEIFEKELGDHFPELREADIARRVAPDIVTKRVS